jgi:predicted site-specific integrase-resolvase
LRKVNASIIISLRVKLSEWARKHGISYLTAWRWFKAGKLPVPARQLPSGTILVEEPIREGRTVLYARVSSPDQKADLERQVERLKAFARARGWQDFEVVAEVGTASRRRKGLLRVLADPGVGLIVVERRFHLGRFGFPLVEAALRASGRRVLALEDEAALSSRPPSRRKRERQKASRGNREPTRRRSGV